MATALAYPEAQRGGDRKSSSFNKLETEGFSKASLSQARFVLRHCRDKAEEVLRNAKYPLTVAYEEAQAIVEAQRLAEEERQRQLAALAALELDSLGAQLVNVVHDELIVECEPEAAGAVAAEVERAMVAGFLAIFPDGCTRDLVEAHSGPNWAAAKE